jgi:hypothetical protein
VGGDGFTVETLAETLPRRCDAGMQLDINQEWVQLNTYPLAATGWCKVDDCCTACSTGVGGSRRHLRLHRGLRPLEPTAADCGCTDAQNWYVRDM